MRSQRESEPLPRFAIYRRDLDNLLRRYAPHEPARAELELLIRNMRAALDRGLPLLARARIAERRARIDHFKSLEKALGACAKLLVERTASKQHTVGRLIGAEIARSLTDDAFRSVGIAVELSPRDAGMIRARAREPDAEITAEERRLRGARSAESPRVLANFLVRCRALVLAHLAAEEPAKGGRLSLPEREYVVASLASVFQDIFGVAPTSTVTGKFVGLSTAILELFVLDTQGVESAAKRVLAKMKAPAGSRSKPKK